MSEPIRLSKYLAETVPCSRREAESFIEGGWVTVDDVVVQEPQFRVLAQTVVLHPDAALAPVEMVTIVYHQLLTPGADALPITMENHASDDGAGIRTLKRHFVKLVPVLPIEPGASGLVVFTQDWRVVRKLVDDHATVEQEYVVEISGELASGGLKQLNHGISFNRRALPPAKVSWQNETRLRFALKGVLRGQIAHMCESVGLKVVTVKRLRIGRVAMGKLAIGQWRYLPSGERF